MVFGEGPLVVISPHLDDGVFSCGDALARYPGSTVITVFAGGRHSYETVTPWDKSSGFRDGDDVVRARRLEDDEALSHLDAAHCWLPFMDAQYGCAVDTETIAEALCQTIESLDVSKVLAPIGLFHSDHLLAHEASMRVADVLRGPAWFLYADAIYRAIPGLLKARLDTLRNAGVTIDSIATDFEPTDQKRGAVHSYRSQLQALAMPGHPGFDDAFRPERYWHIRVPQERR
jgi:LmbE family N-acetylglucosaminyl deacetylase